MSALCLLLAACGGSGGDSGITVELPRLATLDGFVDNNSTVDTAGALAGGIVVGDNLINATARGFFAFDISSIPMSARVRAATLEIRQFSTDGSPYARLGTIVIDHMLVGATLDGTDWNSAALEWGFATVATGPTPETIVLDVTDQVGADVLAALPRTSYRIRFTTLSDFLTDMDIVHFQDSEDSEGSGLLPKLTVRYIP